MSEPNIDMPEQNDGVSEQPSAAASADLPQDAAAEQISVETAVKIIEAVLFAAGYPVTYEKLSETVGFPVGIVRKLAEKAASDFDSCGIQLLLFDNSCQLCTRESYAQYVKKALGIKCGGNLSNSSLEVLAIIAYHQPVTKAYIEQVRGVDCSYPLISLQNKCLIEKSGKLDVPGHPMLYKTTKDFLRCFGISSLDELPEMDIFK